MSQMIKLPQQEMSVEALKTLIAEAEARKPVEGQSYHLGDLPGNNYYVFSNGAWREFWKHNRTDTHSVNMHWPSRWWREGRLVPYTPTPPTFQVGEWIRPIKASDFDLWNNKILKVVPPPDYAADWKEQNVWTEGGWSYPETLRLATPEEIAAATRIQPKKSMLLRRRKSGDVLQVHFVAGTGAAVRNLNANASELSESIASLSIEDYEVLPRYTIEGAEP